MNVFVAEIAFIMKSILYCDCIDQRIFRFYILLTGCKRRKSFTFCFLNFSIHKYLIIIQMCMHMISLSTSMDSFEEVDLIWKTIMNLVFIEVFHVRVVLRNTDT